MDLASGMYGKTEHFMTAKLTNSASTCSGVQTSSDVQIPA